jgi:hypothetical protein
MSKETESDKDRLVNLCDLKPVPDGTYVQVLPGGKVLLRPTQMEYAIIELYAAEMRRLNPSEPAICQA